MRQRVPAFVFVLAACGSCADPLAGVASDGSVEGSRVDRDLQSPAALVGRASLGAPVAGAHVEIRQFDGLVSGDLLGTGSTDASGRFAVPLSRVDIDGWILVIVSGTDGHYSDIADGLTRHFGPVEELMAVVRVRPGVAASEVQINALTTLVVYYAGALRSAEGADAAVSLAAQRLSEHLHPTGFDPTEVAETRLDAPLEWPSPESAVALFHAGLSQQLVARHESGDVLHEVGLSGMVQGLARDLVDGVFDGAPGFGSVSVMTETTRDQLAKALETWNTNQAGVTGLTTEALFGAGGFATLVTADRGILYPPDAAGVDPDGYDPIAPVVAFELPTPADGTALKDDFTLRAVATDARGVVTMTVSGVPIGKAPGVEPAGVREVLVDVSAVADGEVQVEVVATDAAGNEGFGRRTFLIDKLAPALDMTAPARVGSALVHVTGTAADAGSGLDRLQLALDDGEATDVVAVEGVWESTVQVAAGSHTLRMTASDRAGNVATVQQAVFHDALAPVIGGVSPAGGSVVGAGPFAVVATVADESEVASFRARTVGGAWVGGQVDGAGWRVETLAPPSDGPFAVDLEATDALGHVAELAVDFVRDGTAPVLLPLTVVGGVAVLDTQFVGATEAIVRAAVVETIGPVVVEVGGKPAVASGDGFEAVVQIAEVGGEFLAVARDAAGNVATGSVRIASDVTAPTCVLYDLPNGGATSATVVAVGGESADAGSANGVVRIDGGLAAVVAVPAGTYFSTLVAVPEGGAALVATCTDAVGNVSTSNVVTVHADVEPPTVSVSPASGSAISGATMWVKLEVVDPSGVAEVRILGPAAPSVVAAPTGPSEWSATVATPAQDGPFTVAWSAADLAGNERSGGTEYLRDQTAPVILTVTAPTGIARDGVVFVAGTEPIVRVETTDATSGIAAVLLDGELAGPTMGGFERSVAISGESRTVAAQAVDRAGNVAQAGLQLVVDVAAPTCVLDPGVGASVVAGDVVLVTGSSEDLGVGGGRVALFVDGVQAADVDVLGAGFSASVALPPVDGVRTISASCRDALGTAAFSAPILVRRDTTPPAISGTTPPDGGYTPGTAFVLSVQVTDTDMVVGVTAAVQLGQPIAADDGGDGVWTVQLVAPPVDAPYAVKLVAVDRAGNASQRVVGLVRDATPPAIVAVDVPGSVAVGDVRVSSGAAALVQVAASDAGSGVVSVRIGTTEAAKTVTGWEASAAVSNAILEVPVTVKDGVGNTATTVVRLLRDVTGPTCTLTAPANGGWTKAATFTLSGQSVDGTGLPVEVALRTGQTVLGAPTWSGSGFSKTGVGLVAGPNVFFAECRDALGNLTVSKTITVNRDNTPPVIGLSPDDVWVQSGPVIVSALVTEAGGIQGLEYTVDGQTWVPIEGAKAGVASVFTASVPAGAPTVVQVRTADLAGNTRTEATTLTPDDTPPALHAPTVDGAVYRDGVWYMKSTAFRVRMAVDDVAWPVTGTFDGILAALEGNTLVVDLMLAGATTQTVKVVVTDLVGNVSEASVIVKQDLKGPTCQLMSPASGTWFNVRDLEATVLTTDFGAGGVTVTLKGGKAPVALTALNTTMFKGFTNVPGSSTGLYAQCVDALGNATDSGVATVQIDQEPPTIVFGTSQVFDESKGSFDMSVTPPKFTNPLNFSYFGGTHCPTTANGWTCPFLGKFTNRLRHANSGADLLNDNLFWLATDAVDGQTKATLSYRFMKDSVQVTIPSAVPTLLNGTKMVTAVVVGLPYATNSGQLPTSDADWPNAVEITATDTAGNSTVRRIEFDIGLLAPPAKVTAIGTTMASPDPGALTVSNEGAVPFGQSPGGAWQAAGGVRVGQVELSNLHDVETWVSASTTTLLELTRTAAYFLTATGPPVACPAQKPCGQGSGIRVGKSDSADCFLASSSPKTTMTKPAAFLWRNGTSVGTPMPALTNGYYRIPAKGKIHLSVVFPSASSCFVLPPAVYGDDWSYPSPTKTTCPASPEGYAATYYLPGGTCQQIPVDVDLPVKSLRFGVAGGGTMIPVQLVHRYAPAIGASAPFSTTAAFSVHSDVTLKATPP